ncbi:MAG: hypothetical protein QOE25_1590, partial [Actinomycetota bacterium]|nr:hypothetical protein [Actinomycetota bacterium]
LTPADPMLRITVTATNTGSTTIAALLVRVSIGASILTRTQYEASLTEGPGLPVLTRSFPVKGPLTAGASRDLSVQVPAGGPGGIPNVTLDSQVYPLRVGVIDAANGAELGGLNSVAIEIVRQPEKPLRLGWTVEVGGGVSGFDARGQVTPAIESTIAPGGRLTAELTTAKGLADLGVPFDLAVEPSLLDQLNRMTGGYQRTDETKVAAGEAGAVRASVLLDLLRAAAKGRHTQLTSEPYAWSSIPALLQAGLVRDLNAQAFLGRTTVAQLLGVSPDLSVTRPPAGALDDQALRAIITRNASLVLAEPDSITRPTQANDFAPPPAAIVQERNTSATLVLPDPGTQALLQDPSLTQDPVRAAQVTLGELATIWKQEPVPAGDTYRGVAITLPSTLPPTFWSAFTRRVTTAPFLLPVTADKLVAQVPPPSQAARLTGENPATFRSSYVDSLRIAERDVVAFRSMLAPDDPQPGRLERNLFVAESSAYLQDEQAGKAWISAVRALTERTFAKVLPPPNQAFTFTARSGTIPVSLGDPGPRPVKVVLHLESSRMTFPEGATKTITLERANQIATFAITTSAVGPSSVVLTMTAPNGYELGRQVIVVRSTAVNSIALVITLGAGLVLILLWARRWFKRPTR